MLDCRWMMLSLIGLDPLSMVMLGVVAVFFVFTRLGRSRPGLRVDMLAFMSVMADLMVLYKGVGIDVVPAIRSEVKKYRRNTSANPVLHFEARTLTLEVRTKITMNCLFGTWGLT